MRDVPSGRPAAVLFVELCRDEQGRKRDQLELLLALLCVVDPEIRVREVDVEQCGRMVNRSLAHLDSVSDLLEPVYKGESVERVGLVDGSDTRLRGLRKFFENVSDWNLALEAGLLALISNCEVAIAVCEVQAAC